MHERKNKSAEVPSTVNGVEVGTPIAAAPDAITAAAIPENKPAADDAALALKRQVEALRHSEQINRHLALAGRWHARRDHRLKVKATVTYLIF
jgi:hypothetical protein